MMVLGFENIKEFCYLLGLLWADGNVFEHPNNSYYTRTSLEMVKDDIDVILPSLYKAFPFGGNSTRKRDHWKETRTLSTNDTSLFYYLKYNNYCNKSTVSPNKILSVIPDTFKHYWYRGFFDGDGNIYINTQHYTYQVTFSASYMYDWSFLIDTCNNLDISFTICNVIRTQGSYSSLRITNKPSIIKLTEYLYRGDDNISLLRNRDKMYSVG